MHVNTVNGRIQNGVLLSFLWSLEGLQNVRKCFVVLLILIRQVLKKYLKLIRVWKLAYIKYQSEAQQVKVFAVKPHGWSLPQTLSLIPGIHMGDGEN